MRTEKFVVVPYRVTDGCPQPGERRLARSETHAEAIAERLAEHWAGAVAFSIIVDELTGEIDSPREVCAFHRGAVSAPFTDEKFEPRELARFGKAPQLEAA